MTDCNLEPIRFPNCKGRLVKAGFSGGAITSDGGAVLLRQADRMLGLTERAAQALTDPRRKASCRHSLLSMVRQRVYALALGYEDLNDHDELRSDPALLVKRLRQVWPKVKIVFRGDSGFCRPRMLSWCERNHVDYVVGIARNAALAKKAKPVMELAAMAHEASGKKVRVFDEFPYAAKTWRRWSRRVIVKAEHSARGANRDPSFDWALLKAIHGEITANITIVQQTASSTSPEMPDIHGMATASREQGWVSSFSALNLSRFEHIGFQQIAIPLEPYQRYYEH